MIFQLKFSALTLSLIFAILLAISLIFLEKNASNSRILFNVDSLRNSPSIGTPLRAEREFKITISPDKRFFTNQGLIEIQNAVFAGLRDGLIYSEWQAPKIAGNPYFIERDPINVITRDIYFDTADSIAFNHAISYRLRHRFKSENQLLQHEIKPKNSIYYPYRGEIQGKVGREELGNGYSRVNEARLEFRLESPPFSLKRPPPPAPWLPRDFVSVLKSGLYEGKTSSPGQAVAAYLADQGLSGSLQWLPAIALFSKRLRMHLNLKTAYGSGPNPTQAFIVTIDRSDVLGGSAYQEYLSSAWYLGADAPRPPILGTFLEVEIEFERNVSSRLDAKITLGGDPLAKPLRQALLADQLKIKSVILTAINRLRLKADDGKKSKYQTGNTITRKMEQ
jgi:hypothetical protein